MSNILFGKLGQKIVFDRGLPEAIRSNTNGNYESYNMLRILLEPFENVFVVEDNIAISFEQQKLDDSLKIITDFVPKIDCAFILLGVDENNMSKKLLSIINSGIKWYALCSDPRCLQALAKYIINPPVAVFAGAKNLSCSFGGKEFKTEYLNIESANVYGERPRSTFEYKHDGMVVVANETNTWNRIDNIKKMTSLIPDEKIIIYGRCKEEDRDARFAGEFPVQHIYNSQRLCKVTYVAPIAPGWITAKYLECIYRGIIPLLSAKYGTMIPSFIKDIKSYVPEIIVHNSHDVSNMYNLITTDEKYYRGTLYKLVRIVEAEYSCKVLKDKLVGLSKYDKHGGKYND